MTLNIKLLVKTIANKYFLFCHILFVEITLKYIKTKLNI